MDWKEWFRMKSDAYKFWKSEYMHKEHDEEERYQAFKGRLIEELIVDNPDFRVMGILKERSI